ncbi:MAG: thioredoxin family protein [candidate division Zixibacteria bacterium]|nr:thioredoxin family protein [candidate division Zixibacteria bacterium]MBU1469690.1 thioredoxin family protein [candidate division Zixibacteria bacterium]MBU2626821.1 thioredoxin family protein [candidate division Zixibacteria bacterium]
MKKAAIITVLIMAGCSGVPNQQKPVTLDQAKAQSADTGKPILLEFFHKACEYCDEFEQDADTSAAIKNVLKSVVHLTVDAESDDGGRLADQYDVGSTFPVMILITRDEEIIRRWTGYTTADDFVQKMQTSLADHATINERLKRYEANPTIDDALVLAKHYEEISEHLKAIDFYRQADELNKDGVFDHSYEIFLNTANAIWKDQLEFDRAHAAADGVFHGKRLNTGNILKVALMMARLGRKADKADDVGYYLQEALRLTEKTNAKQFLQSREWIKADYALHIDHDTSLALDICRESLGEGWENDRDQAFLFAKWCLERKINLAEAEAYARRTVEVVQPGHIKAMVAYTVAEICEERGNLPEAVEFAKIAAAEDTESDYYQKQFTRLQEKSVGK